MQDTQEEQDKHDALFHDCAYVDAGGFCSFTKCFVWMTTANEIRLKMYKINTVKHFGKFESECDVDGGTEVDTSLVSRDNFMRPSISRDKKSRQEKFETSIYLEVLSIDSD